MSTPVPPPRTDRRRLALLAVPMAAVAVASNVGNAIAPTLLVESPTLLTILSPRLRWLLLLSPQLDPLTFFAIPLVRAAAVLLLWFTFGRRYGRRAVRWLEDRIGPAGRRRIAWVEHRFHHWRAAIVPIAPGPGAALLAGADGMAVGAFLALALVGVGARLVLVRWLADLLRGPLLDVLDWVAANQLWLTGVSVLTVAVTMAWSRRRPEVAVESVEELATELDVAADELDREAPRPDDD